MSRTLHLKDVIDALCAAAGLEPNDVSYIAMDANRRSVQFTVYPRPLKMDLATREPESYIVTFPFKYKA